MDDLLGNVHRLPPPHVVEARDAVVGPRDLVPCGRATRRGTACRQARMRFGDSCARHATATEQTAANAEHARLTAVYDEWAASLTPVCHTWPVTDGDSRAVAELSTDLGDELRAARRTHDLLYRWQAGRCAVCGTRNRSEDLVLDHDHITALVRGWLCRSCNTSEPHSDLGDFAKYRANPPAVMLGVTARYERPWYGLAEPQESHAEWFTRALANEPPPATNDTTAPR